MVIARGVLRISQHEVVAEFTLGTTKSRLHKWGSRAPAATIDVVGNNEAGAPKVAATMMSMWCERYGQWAF